MQICLQEQRAEIAAYRERIINDEKSLEVQIQKQQAEKAKLESEMGEILRQRTHQIEKFKADILTQKNEIAALIQKMDQVREENRNKEKKVMSQVRPFWKDAFFGFFCDPHESPIFVTEDLSQAVLRLPSNQGFFPQQSRSAPNSRHVSPAQQRPNLTPNPSPQRRQNAPETSVSHLTKSFSNCLRWASNRHKLGLWWEGLLEFSSLHCCKSR